MQSDLKNIEIRWMILVLFDSLNMMVYWQNFHCYSGQHQHLMQVRADDAVRNNNNSFIIKSLKTQQYLENGELYVWG